MEHRLTPPPVPEKKKGQMSIGLKVVLIGAICFVLAISTLAVWLLAYSRENTSERVSDSIAGNWGSDLYFRDILISDSTEEVFPDNVNISFDVKTKTLHRGIYDADVFNTDIDFSATCKKRKFRVLGDTVRIVIGLDPDMVTDFGELTVNGRKCNWETFGDYRIGTTVSNEEFTKTGLELKGRLSMRGARQINCTAKSAVVSTIIMEGSARNPSFNSIDLPDERTVSDNEFRAEWKLMKGGTASTTFLVGVDTYQKVTRSIKYAFMIIVLTFSAVFFTEIYRKTPIPLLNYFLIGAALIIFYSLLLAFAEHLGFAPAYLIAAAMTVSLIGGYMWRMLDSKATGIFIAILLTAIYAICFVMLTTSNYALLVGSLTLFFAIAAMMYGSLKMKR